MVLLGLIVAVLFFISNDILKGLLVPLGVPCLAVEGIHLATMAVVTGFAGPFLYVRWAKWKVGMLVRKYEGVDEIALKQKLLKAGGTNLKGTLKLVLIPFGLLVGLLFINYLQEPELVTEAFLQAWRAGGCGV